MRARLEAIARAAVQACSGEPLCREHGRELAGAGPAVAFAAGKAAGAMAQGLAQGFADAGVALEFRLVVTKDRHPAAPSALFAGHPVPDGRSASTGRALREGLAALSASERAIVLLSGGASALLAEPVAALSVAELADTNRRLLASGVPIADVNTVRKHLTRVAGGRLALGTRAAVQALLLSDVLGDDVATIASGPLSPDPTSSADALAIARRVGDLPAVAMRVLEDGVAGRHEETPKPGHAAFSRIALRILASHVSLLAAARACASAADLQVRALEPWAGDVAAAAARLSDQARTLRPGEIVVTGGEPTVRLPPAPGRGGRCQQLALGLAKRSLVFFAALPISRVGALPSLSSVDVQEYASLLRLGITPVSTKTIQAPSWKSKEEADGFRRDRARPSASARSVLLYASTIDGGIATVSAKNTSFLSGERRPHTRSGRSCARTRELVRAPNVTRWQCDTCTR